MLYVSIIPAVRPKLAPCTPGGPFKVRQGSAHHRKKGLPFGLFNFAPPQVLPPLARQCQTCNARTQDRGFPGVAAC